MNAEIARHHMEIKALCEEYGVVRLELFGSATGDAFNPTSSDFDFVATFVDSGPDSDYGRRFLKFSRSLERVLGRPVDVITPESIGSPRFRSEIATTRQSVYATSR